MAIRAHKQEVRSNTAVGSLPTEIREISVIWLTRKGKSHLHPTLPTPPPPTLAQRFEFYNDRIIQEIIVEQELGEYWH